jgi:two-component system response regulator HydG
MRTDAPRNGVPVTTPPVAVAGEEHALLLVDDDKVFLEYLARLLKPRGFRVLATSDPRDAVSLYEEHRPEVVLIDYRMPRTDGLKVLAALRAADPEAVVILLSGAVDVATTVRAMRAGAEDVLTKTVEVDHLVVTLERGIAKASLARRHRMVIAKSSSMMGLLDDSPAMMRAFRLIEVTARSNSPVLITGETGAGKGLAASVLHQLSARAAGPFVRVNCASLSATFLESELFGHERGAFTDAKQEKRGLFEVATGGTIFLDEIGELAMDLQAKLLTVLDEGRFRRLGGTREIAADVRVVSATNRDLAQLVAAKRFRSDLYYRLAVLPINIPPLRARGRDAIISLAAKLLREHQSEVGRGPTRFSPEALEVLAGFSWPGNVRQLRNVIEQAFPFAIDSGVVDLGHLPPLAADKRGIAESDTGPSGRSLRDVERRHIARVLSGSGGNRSQAARILGVTRTTLYNKMREYGLEDIGFDE